MREGWIKLHRQLRESSFYGNVAAVAIWVECLMRAAHDGGERYIGREKVKIDKGGFVMGYREMGDKVGCSGSTVKAWMDVFVREGMVERSSNAKGTLCKLKKWSEYQDGRTLTERSQNADGTLTEPNKKVKNERMKEDTSLTVKGHPGVQVIIDKTKECFGNLDDSEKMNRRYAWLLLKKAKMEVSPCLALIQEASKHEWWGSRITKVSDLYRNSHKIANAIREKEKTKAVFIS